ncbi:helix-turn-helix domain-containing protein [Lacticaseibacillus mingshuiensis]|uniref:Helix-turn-helix domain-containing protein n=1 Tax=Lacticaseibacillus mingshuiensis TaxID=2799574 RepID=A0ABW4CLV2_9LACO|nr:helix-turn-helix transcriptional regulator [Lacticaseibacillus mingshuiensis]
MIEIDLDKLMLARGMLGTDLAAAIDITPANLSILKTGKAKGVRFNTLAALCQALDCQPGDILRYVPDQERK